MSGTITRREMIVSEIVPYPLDTYETSSDREFLAIRIRFPDERGLITLFGRQSWGPAFHVCG